MSKSVLVIDTPEHGCISCLIGRNHSNILETCIYCPIVGKCVLDKEAETIPDWCPLKPLPEEKEEEYWRSRFSLAWIRGWNTCISKIKGGNADG
jgi:hypothetical protein|nr:MAG TPA: hypothetical protein [Caudoviricetes sp.]DAO51084.1 MAG TPA: hypothetical protein [Caudoviricetes sp.]